MTATPTFPLALNVLIEVTDSTTLGTVAQQIREENGVLGVDDLTADAQAVKVLGDLLQPLFGPNATGIVLHDLKGYSGPVWANAPTILGGIRARAKAIVDADADGSDVAFAREILEMTADG